MLFAEVENRIKTFDGQGGHRRKPHVRGTTSVAVEQKPLAGAEALDGRRRLAGAYFIEIGRIHPDPTQPRRQLDNQAQYELTQSVKQFGIMQPIAVRYIEAQKIYQIISGERRPPSGPPCQTHWNPLLVKLLVRRKSSCGRSSRTDSGVTDIFELADALAAIRDTNKLSQDGLAKLTGKPKGEISKLLALLSLAPGVQKSPARQVQTLCAGNCMRSRKCRRIVRSNSSRKCNGAGLKVVETEELVARREKQPSHRRGSPHMTMRRFRPVLPS